MLKDFFLWFYWYPFRLFVQKIPPRYAYKLARISGLILYYMSSQRRDALRKEFYNVFSELPGDNETENIIQESFVVLCQNEIEVMLFTEIRRDNIKNFVEYSGLHNLDKALLAGKGAMLMFAHFGANQMIMPAIGYRGYKMSQISASATVWIEKLPGKKFSAMGKLALELRWEQELSLPVTHINIFSSIKGAFSCLKRNEILGIAIDGGGGKDRITVDFFGGKVLLSTGAVEIAMRTGCAVLPTFMIRGRDGRSKMIIEPPLEIQGSVHRIDAIRENMIAFVKTLEKYVMRHPSHYLNFLVLRRFMATQGDAPFFVKEENKLDVQAVDG